MSSIAFCLALGLEFFHKTGDISSGRNESERVIQKFVFSNFASPLLTKLFLIDSGVGRSVGPTLPLDGRIASPSAGGE